MLLDIPKSLADPNVVAARLRSLHESHMAPLTRYVEALRTEAGPDARIPYFDPCDGGVEARILFLLEAPGSKAVSSGFISRNNPDETAKNMFEMCQEAGLRRTETVLWNVVPWYIGSGTKIRAATPEDLERGLQPLPRLLELLPQLKTIVLLGRNAERAKAQIDCVKYRVLVAPHPSPLFVNNAPGNRERILSVLRTIRQPATQLRTLTLESPPQMRETPVRMPATECSAALVDLDLKLRTLEGEFHASGRQHLKFNQQSIVAANMSFSGANGRIWIQPVGDCIDVSLSGQSLTAAMTPVMEKICGAACDGYKQTNRRLGKQDQPFWRIRDFSLVREAIISYAGTVR